jgi:vacuolar-type H+-ATPase subunit H
MSDIDMNIGDSPAVEADLEELLGEITETIERAKSMPLSSSAIIGRDEVLELLGAAQQALPDELARARRVLQDHEALRATAQREAAQLLDEARAQAAHLVQRTEIVRQARHEAERLVAEADAESRRIRHEAEDYVDRKLAAFEIVLDRTIRTVQAGRERLTSPPTSVGIEPVLDDDDADGGLFDQDIR